MPPRTLKALKESIAKWERNAVAVSPHEYLTDKDDCPLCSLFWYDHCKGCPVRDRTRQTRCYGTPYDDANMKYRTWEEGLSTADAARAAARKEVAFLKSLLPEGEQS